MQVSSGQFHPKEPLMPKACATPPSLLVASIITRFLLAAGFSKTLCRVLPVALVALGAAATIAALSFKGFHIAESTCARDIMRAAELSARADNAATLLGFCLKEP